MWDKGGGGAKPGHETIGMHKLDTKYTNYTNEN